jgi:hypothetical protein
LFKRGADACSRATHRHNQLGCVRHDCGACLRVHQRRDHRASVSNYNSRTAASWLTTLETGRQPASRVSELTDKVTRRACVRANRARNSAVKFPKPLESRWRAKRLPHLQRCTRCVKAWRHMAIRQWKTAFEQLLQECPRRSLLNFESVLTCTHACSAHLCGPFALILVY